MKHTWLSFAFLGLAMLRSAFSSTPALATKLTGQTGEVNQWQKTIEPVESGKWTTLTTLREKLVKIGAKVVKHARYSEAQKA